MRRILSFCFLFLFVLGAVFYRQATHFLVGTLASVHSGCTLSFKSLSFNEGRLVLEGVHAFNAGLYEIDAPQISIGYEFPNSVHINITSPHLVLSPKFLKSTKSSSKSMISVSVDVSNGVLEWTDAIIGPAQLDLIKTDAHTKLSLVFEKGSLKYQDGRLEWADLPLAWASVVSSINEFPIPIIKTASLWSGEFEGTSFHAESSDLVAKVEDCIYKGSFSLDIHKPTSFSYIPERFRLLIHQGEVQTPYSSVKNIELLASYQSGIWGMCECKALCGDLPLSFEGKGFLTSTRDGWMNGALHLGGGLASLFWESGSGTIECTAISSKELAAIQQLARVFEPRIASFDFKTGVLEAKLLLKDSLKLESVTASDFFIKTPELQFGCKKLNLLSGDWIAEQIFINGFHGNGRWRDSLGELSVEGLFEEIPGALSWNLSGDTKGSFGDLNFLGNLQLEDRNLRLILNQIQGRIPELPQVQGSILSGSADVLLGYDGQIQLGQWEASCKIIEGTVPAWSISGVEVNLIADSDTIDLNGSGTYLCPNGLPIALSIPKIRVKGDNALFDLRLEESNCCLLRAVGSKQGPSIHIDLEKSHLFGSPLASGNLVWEKGALSTGHMASNLQWHLVSHFLEKTGMLPAFNVPLSELHVEADFNHFQGLKLALSGGGWQSKAIYKEKLWNITAANEQMQAYCDLFAGSDALLQIKNGRLIHNEALTLSFDGKVFNDFSADLLLTDIVGDLSILQNKDLKGPFLGHGCVTVSQRGIESDLDINVASLQWKAIQIDSLNPIHLYGSSENGILLKGLDFRATSGVHEARGKIGLIEYNKNRSRIAVQKGSFHLTSDFLLELDASLAKGIDPGFELDFLGTFDFSTDFSDMNCFIERASAPIAGQVRHLKNIQFAGNQRSTKGFASVSHLDQSAKLSFDILKEASNYKGTLYIQDEALKPIQNPMSISWSYDPSGLSIHAVKGSFAGLVASFQSAKIHDASELVGSLSVDFHKLCNWIDPEIASGIAEIGLGRGYELKGSLSLNKKDLSDFSFKGILGGKQIQLFDFQFRTMMSSIEINLEKIQIKDISISDTSMSAKIDQILIESNKESPWKIQIPLVTIEDLRPSLLRKPGAKEPSLSPLVVRQFSLRDFCGLLDDSKTYTATGDLSFVNTFKREETFFDLPSNLFGSIIGLDFDLLIPVIGDLTFDLKDGFFQLTELKNAFSAGNRSEFFLVDADALHRVDLKGNLQILVKMKQFVLFALTQGFMISIDGNLSSPHFRLQKRLKYDYATMD